MPALVGKPAPDFTLMALVNGQFKEIRLSDFKAKKKVVLFFYPADFTFVCPTEILAFSDSIQAFWKRKTVVLGISVDSVYSHHAWARVPRDKGGIAGVTFPLLSDAKREVAADYGVLLEESGQALRGLFIVNTKGILKHITVNHNDIGRNVNEVLRVVDAIEYSEAHGVVCPANWKAGQRAILPTQEGLEEYTATSPAPVQSAD
jgi:alkyl hydroperoxide reductase subunit AhpC